MKMGNKEEHYEPGLFARMKKGVIETGLAAIVTVGLVGCGFESARAPKKEIGDNERATSVIAFYSYRDRNYEIYVMNEDGSNQRNLTNNLGSDRNPSWSPDGKKIAFDSNRDGDVEVYVVNADGSNQKRLTNNPGYDFVSSWSPDGKKIVFDSYRDGNREVYVMNADGSNQKRLTNNPRDDMSPSLMVKIQEF